MEFVHDGLNERLMHMFAVSAATAVALAKSVESERTAVT